MLQPGRIAWRCRAWLRDVPRAGSALRQAAAAPLAQVWSVPVWHAARLRVRGAGVLRHCKLKVCAHQTRVSLGAQERVCAVLLHSAR